MRRKTIKMSLGAAVIMAGVMLTGCGKDKRAGAPPPTPNVTQGPDFNADSAYLFIQRQVDFGPRIPNTPVHQQTLNYLVATLRAYGAAVRVQAFDATSYDGHRLQLNNIIAAYAPEKQLRILLGAHWDTRPMADKDSLHAMEPFDGANDGASGVGVLLEVARLLSSAEKPAVGVDIVLFDGEDWGAPDNVSPPPTPEGWNSWWCLGSQYWARKAAAERYSAYYGILLDMVGAQGATFFKEGVSMEHAPRIVDKTWNAAAALGYGGYFVDRTADGITDDHLYVNELAKIPMINIVHYDTKRGYFASYHHTKQDNMNLISKETLKAVGQTVTAVVYSETAE